MKKTDIEWADRTFNPITGCLHGCGYCYARNIVRRFEGYYLDCLDESNESDPPQGIHGMDCEPMEERVLDSPLPYKTKKGKIHAAPYPFGFAPTFHRHKLERPAKVKEPSNVFVGSMADNFGEWLPEEWQAEVFKACEDAPQHRYLFLTKHYDGIPPSSFVYSGVFKPHNDNFWFGATVTTQKDIERAYRRLTNVEGHTFLSIEPLHGAIELRHIDVGDVIYDIGSGYGYYLGGGQKAQRPNWIIIGAETGSRKGKIKPEREWVEKICEAADQAGIPVFMKDSLLPVMGADGMRCEFPEGLRKEGKK
ncbi:MAG: phage Gp37/Gp68 family protein [Clostridium sp.]|nr:phage Gp37/Gp68 family protein [Clostridium sp.]